MSIISNGTSDKTFYRGLVSDPNELVDLISNLGFKIVYNDESGEFYIIRRLSDGSIEYYILSGDAIKHAKLIYDYDTRTKLMLASRVRSIRKYFDLGLTYSALAVMHSMMDELRRLFLEEMDESYKIIFAEKLSTRTSYIDAYKHGEFYRYALKPGVGEAIKNILLTIISYLSSISTPSSIEATIIAKILLQMLEYDPIDPALEYNRCIKRKIPQHICERYLQVPGTWYVKSLTSDSIVIDDVNRFLNELESSIASALGEVSWSEDILQFPEVIIWIYREGCGICKVTMDTNEFKNLQRVVTQILGIPFFIVNVNDPVTRSMIYNYLVIKTLLFDIELVPPILIYYNIPARKILIWSSGEEDHEKLPIDEHLGGLANLFFEVKKDNQGKTQIIEKTGATEIIIRKIKEYSIIGLEDTRKKRRDLIKQEIIRLLKRYGSLKKHDIMQYLSKSLKVSPATIGRVLSTMIGKEIVEENGKLKLITRLQ